MPELASLELEVMQRRAEERRTRLRERLFRCQLEMAGLQAALKKARQLKNG